MTSKIVGHVGEIISRMTVKKIRRYLLWDCSSCDAKGINANTCNQCPFCGSPKELDDHKEQEYRSATIVDVTYQHRGADISCTHCGSDNQKRFSCRNCGVALDPAFAKKVAQFTACSDADWRTRKVQVDTTGYVIDSTTAPWEAESTLVHTSVTASAAVPQYTGHSRQSSRRIPFIIAVTLLAIFGGAGAWWVHSIYTTLTPATAQVTSVSWRYSLPREDFALRNKTHTTENVLWEPPETALNITNETVVIDTENLYDNVWVVKSCVGTEDNSYNDTDGTWVEQIDEVTYDCSSYELQKVGEENIYGTKWSYQVHEWRTTESLVATGVSHVVDFPLFVDTATLRASAPAVTTFTISVSYADQSGDEAHTTRTIPRQRWEDIRVGDTFPAVIDGFGNLRAIATIDEDYKDLETERKE